MGRSLLPALQNESVRDELFVEFNNCTRSPGFSKPARARSLITKSHRYTRYSGQGWGELYDLTATPQETRNLWDEYASRDVRFELAERLADQLAELTDDSPRADRMG